MPFLEECTWVLDVLVVVYAADAHAREKQFTPPERPRIALFHVLGELPEPEFTHKFC